METLHTKEELEYLKANDFDPGRYLIFSPGLASEARKIPGHSPSVILIHDDECEKYFGKKGYYVASVKWCERSGFLSTYEFHKENGVLENKVNGQLPNLTPEQAFGDEKLADKKEEPQSETKSIPPPPGKVEDQDLINYDRNGNPRSPELIAVLKDLQNYGGRTAFLYARGYISDKEKDCFIHRTNGSVIGMAPLANLIKGWDFYEYWKVQYDAGEKEAANRKAKMEVVPDEIKEVAAASDNVIVASMPEVDFEKARFDNRVAELIELGFTKEEEGYIKSNLTGKVKDDFGILNSWIQDYENDNWKNLIDEFKEKQDKVETNKKSIFKRRQELLKLGFDDSSEVAYELAFGDVHEIIVHEDDLEDLNDQEWEELIAKAKGGIKAREEAEAKNIFAKKNAEAEAAKKEAPAAEVVTDEIIKKREGQLATLGFVKNPATYIYEKGDQKVKSSFYKEVSTEGWNDFLDGLKEDVIPEGAPAGEIVEDVKVIVHAEDDDPKEDEAISAAIDKQMKEDPAVLELAEKMKRSMDVRHEAVESAKKELAKTIEEEVQADQGTTVTVVESVDDKEDDLIGAVASYRESHPEKKASTSTERDEIVSDMEFVEKMASVFSKYSETIYAIHRMKAVLEMDLTKTKKYNELESILKEI